MLGLKSHRTAAVVIGGIELAEKIKKDQFKIGKLGGRTARMPEIGQSRPCRIKSESPSIEKKTDPI
jgi:hypothetical protein